MLANSRFSWFLAIFYCACAETVVSEVLDSDNTSLLNSAIPISCKSRKFLRSESIYSSFWKLVFFPHAQKPHYFYFRFKIRCHHRSQQHPFPKKVFKFWLFDNLLVYFWPYFTAHAQKQRFSSFRSQFWIQQPRFLITFIRVENFDDQKSLIAVIGHFLCACAETPLFLLPVRNLLSVSATSISYITMEILAIWQRFSWFLAILYSVFQASRYNCDNADRRPRFPIRRGYFGNRNSLSVLFLHIITRNAPYSYFYLVFLSVSLT